jgi:hypothetical protein
VRGIDEMREVGRPPDKWHTVKCLKCQKLRRMREPLRICYRCRKRNADTERRRRRAITETDTPKMGSIP